jgi:hypothetical protein
VEWFLVLLWLLVQWLSVVPCCWCRRWFVRALVGAMVGAMLLLLAELYELFTRVESPAVAIVSVFLVGIEELTVALEEPFSILPMQKFCDGVKDSCFDMKTAMEQHWANPKRALRTLRTSGSWFINMVAKILLYSTSRK